MKQTIIKNKKLWLPFVLASSLLVACGEASNDTEVPVDDTIVVAPPAELINVINENAGAPDGNPGNCAADVSGVNWNALMTENCRYLSDYNLFQDNMNPTTNPTNGGVAYDLSVQLFTDYTSKYRFAFIPEGSTVQYDQNEVLEFPVGSVLVKTFAMPTDTSDREGEELIIETRLLIHRANGWVARPYYWSDVTDAQLAITGKVITDMTTTHKGELLTFSYSVPKAAACTSCHSVVPLSQGPDDTRQPVFKPIGPKARFLNHELTYADTTQNQLQYWADNGVLAGLPNVMDTVQKIRSFTDQTIVANLPMDEANEIARGYLDINCAHCHRSELTIPEENYAGPAGGSGLQVEYNRSYSDDPSKFGVCKVAVAGGHEDYSADVIPQDADDSYLLFRMNTTDPRHRMPELGRSIVHSEGVELIKHWINNLPAAACSPES